MIGIADITCFNQLVNQKKEICRRSYYVFNDEEVNNIPADVSATYSHRLIQEIDSNTSAWMDEIEDMRTIGTDVEAEASSEEAQLDKILQDTVDRLEASVTACRQLKVQLRKTSVGQEAETETGTEGGEDTGGEDLGLDLGTEEEEA